MIVTSTRNAMVCFLAGLFSFAFATPARATDVKIEGRTLTIVDAEGGPNALDVRFDGLSYQIYDDLSRLVPGAGCYPAGAHHVTCFNHIERVTEVTVDAGDGGDVVDLSDILVPLSANGGAGDDLIQGGRMGDEIEGGPGADALFGASGNDDVTGGAGDDLLKGDTGSDHLSGGDNADILEGEDGGGDLLQGQDGPDLLKGGDGDDVLQGGTGDDFLVTGHGDDVADLGGGSDTLLGTSRDSVTRCQPGDKVNSAAASKAEGCAPSNVRQPQAWPPSPDPTFGPQAARAAQIPDLGWDLKRISVLSLGSPRKLRLTFEAHTTRTIALRITTYRDPRKRHRIGKSFVRNVETKPRALVKLPRSRIGKVKAASAKHDRR